MGTDLVVLQYHQVRPHGFLGCAHHRKIAGGTAVTPLPNRYG